MSHCIAWILMPLLRRLLPAPGRHRADPVPPEVCGEDEPTMVLPRQPGWSIDDLVRPYVLSAAERRSRRERTEQRERRRALWLASYGIDVGPSRIHGVEVAQ